MPGVLVDDTPADHALALPGALPHPAPSPLSPHVRHYIPVLRSSVTPDFCGGESPSPQRSPLLPPACLNVSSLLDMHTEDGNSLEAGLLLQLSPASTPGQWGFSSASPTTQAALAALQQFLPSNFEEDEEEHASHTDVYSCDEFRMYEFKVRRCMRGRSHDWTECPFAHPGEKARRRDPRRFIYSGTACADFRRGSCKKGDACEYAHGVFECWLHPSRYRTQPCKDGRGCRRRICFFAHTPDQLRFVSPMSSPPAALSSPISLHLCANEAFELCGSSSPYRSPSKKVSSEPFKLPLTSSPLCRMAMEAPPDGCFPSAVFSPPASAQSLSTSSPITPINWSLKGISTFALPAAAMPQLHLSPHSNQSQASFAPVPVSATSAAQYRHLPERRNQCLSLPIPQAQSGSNPASPLPTNWTPSYTATSAMQRAESLMGFLKQSDLTQEETDWQGQPASYFDRNAVLQQGGGRGSVGEGEAPVKKGCSRVSEEEILLGRFCDDHEEEAEPKLERVESGKGLRAQIFQSLLRTASQPTCRIYQDSNSEPLRSSSSSLGF